MKKLIKWLLSVQLRPKAYRHKIVQELPDKLKPGTLYILDNQGYHWQIVLVCPCGCKTPLHVNLVPDHSPFWKYSISKSGYLSIYPSLHRKKGCSSHFFISDGKVNWCT